MFLHDTPHASASLSNKKTILNKRVSHTLDGTVSSTEKQDSDNQPKTLSQPPISTSIQTSSNTSEDTSTDKIQTPSVVVSALSIEEIEAILNSKIELCKTANLSVKNFLFFIVNF